MPCILALMSHKPIEELSQSIINAGGRVEVGALYTHYKDPTKQYKVLFVGIQEWNDEPCVIYEWQYGPRFIFVRPLSNWLEEVEGKPRFAKA